jgi:hypothetical protein
MNILGAERIVTQTFSAHQNTAEDYAGNFLSDIKIFGTGKVISVVNKYKSYEDTINYNDFLNNKSKWKNGNYYNCVSISGKVVRYNQSELGGNEVWLECYHNDSKLYYRFNHLAEVLVNVGDIVNSDTVIGKQGNTGLVLSNKPRTDYSYGTHLHFEVRDKNYKPINPREYAIGNIVASYIEQSNIIDECKKQIKIIADKINIRENYNTSSKDLGDVYRGEIYTILDEIEDNNYIWYKIKTNLNVNGYVASLKNGNWIEVLNSTPNVEIVDQAPEGSGNIHLIFECKKDGLYALRLNNGEKLYLE